jgi:transposase-like protein
MESDSRGWSPGEGTLEELVRERIRATIETIVDEELEAALGAARSQRVGQVRAGYRHGKRTRPLVTSLSPTTISMPAGRLLRPNRSRL